MKVKKKVYMARFKTDWGEAGIGWTDDGICRLTLPSRDGRDVLAEIAESFPGAGSGNPAEVGDVVGEVRDYFSGKAPALRFEVDLAWATPFQRSVYMALRSIPYGQTRSYGQIAASLGKAGAARAVGAANAANRVPLIIPCHRVICADKSLGGFSGPGGPSFKKKLIELETRTRSRIAKQVFCIF